MEENKSKKNNAGIVVCVCVIILLFMTMGGMYYYYNYIIIPKIKTTSSMISNNNENIIEQENKTENSTSLYEKYDGLYWHIRDNEYKTEYEWTENEKIQIENGVAYLYIENVKTEITSIEGKPKYVNGWGEQTLEKVYILTEEGTIWESICDDTSNHVSSLNTNFTKINFDEKVIDYTAGAGSTRVTEPPYFLLANGKLVNKDGSNYEELEGDFINRVGSNFFEVWVKRDNTIYSYDNESREYKQIKDENGKSIKVLEAVTYSHAIDRIFIITENYNLLYMDSDSTEKDVAKNYEKLVGKTIKDVSIETKGTYTKYTENEEWSKYWDGKYNEKKNLKIIFNDGSEELIEIL